MEYVIGSGPSGVACAMALLRRGRDVTMLDGGEALEPERQQAVERLRMLDPSEWNGTNISFLKEGVVADRKGVGVKRIFGSDYPYRGVEQLMPTHKKGVDTKSSLAVGGLSAAWGSAILPFRDEDMVGWPLRLADLAPYYRDVLSLMGTSLVQDDLAELFPLFVAPDGALRRSRQADSLMRDLEKHRIHLRAQGIWFGAARLATRPHVRGAQPGCTYCGLCMYGCPYGLIYSAEDTLAQLAEYPKFHRISGVVVERLQETNEGSVLIRGRQRTTGASVDFTASRVYLAAGALASSRIVLRSQEAYGKTVTLKNSQYFLLPILRYAGTARVQKEALHTLAQVFLEIIDPEICDRTVHLQVYTYNDLYEAAIRRTAGPAAGLLRPIWGALLGRMLTVQGYLHSDFSPAIGATLERRADNSDLLRLEALHPEGDQAHVILKRIVHKLSQNARWLRSIPIGPLLNKPDAGHGFHVGGTFPMSERPVGFQSDLLGRPAGFNRVHLVDSSVLPSIPATTITFSVMANAFRIGSLAGA